MGLFSQPPPVLNARVAERLSSAFRADVVGKREYKIGIDKLAREQDALLAALDPDENIVVIVPCLRQRMYEGLAVLTNQRLLEFKRKIRNQLAVSQIVSTGLATHPGGFIIFHAKGPNYRPYTDRMSNAALDEHKRNYLQINIASSVEVARHFTALVNEESERHGS